MKRKLRDWLSSTHSPEFELLRHFLSTLFQSESALKPDDWLPVAWGLFATLVSSGILGLGIYGARYSALQASESLYRRAVLDDMLGFAAIAMAATAALTALNWESLFPTRRDCYALAGLPLSPRQIFSAKLASVLAVFAVFVCAAFVVPAGLFTAVSSGRWQQNPALIQFLANFTVPAAAAVFTLFVLLSLQGLLLQILPARTFERASQFVQACVFILAIGLLPLAGRQPQSAWWPPMWFVSLRGAILWPDATRPDAALAALFLPACLSAMLYIIGYRRYERLLTVHPTPGRIPLLASLGTALLDRCMPDPRQQAAFSFIAKTLARSRSHRSVLLAYAGLAVAWVVEGLLDIAKPSLGDQGLYGFTAVVAPLSIALLTVTALRYLFSLPSTLQANWIFQISDEAGRGAWLLAVERFIIWVAVVPAFIAGLPFSIAILGPVRAIAAALLGFCCTVVWFEWLYRGWSKLPFTCSYIPGKRPVVITFTRYGFSLPLMAAAGQLVLFSSGGLVTFCALLSFEVALIWKLRSARRQRWAGTLVSFQDSGLLDIHPLELAKGGTLDTPATAAQPASPSFSTISRSTQVLPSDWSDELAADRRQPSRLIADLWEDTRYGLRLIRRTPLLSAIVVLTLTVGIGINASVYTVVNGLALRPHVEKDPERFVRIIARSQRQNTARPLSYREYIALRDTSRTVHALAAFSWFPALIGDDDASGSIGMMASCNFFAVDGLDRPLLGRLWTPDDCRVHGAAPLALLSESLWRARFAADPAIVGRVIHINNRPVTVIGVLPARAGGWTLQAKIWLNYSSQTWLNPAFDAFNDDNELWLNIAGRLAPGYTRGQAEAELDVLARRHDRQHPGRYTAIVTTDGSWADELGASVSGQRLMLVAFFIGTFYLVLIIACANVATLLLSRAAARRREIAIRLSLGATRIRLLRMLVIESLLLSAAAGLLSVSLVNRVPVPLYRWIVGSAPEFSLAPDWRIFSYVALTVLITGILAGAAPAFESLKVDLTSALKGYAGLGARFGWKFDARDTLVAAQVALSMTLLVEAGVFGLAEYQALHADPGYAARNIAIAPLHFPENTTAVGAGVRLDAIRRRVLAIPGVSSASFSSRVPMFNPETVVLVPPERPDAAATVDVYTASPAFFSTLGIPLLRGREFVESDTSGVVVSAALARAFWPGQDPIGRELALPSGALTVVGIARDTEPMRYGGSDNPSVYKMHRIDPHFNVMAVRFQGPAQPQVVRAALREVEPGLMVISLSLQGWIDSFTAILWNVVSFVLILGLVATALATTGIYGAVSFAAGQRIRDMGIRLALGARRRHIVFEVLRSGGRPVGIGLLVGLWFAVPVTVGLRKSLEGSPLRLDVGNPLVYTAAAILLVAAALTAMIGPARRSSLTDPCEALRTE